LLESGNLICSAAAGTKPALDIIQLWFSFFAASIFKALDKANVNYLKYPKKHRGPHAARVFETALGANKFALMPSNNQLYTIDVFVRTAIKCTLPA